MRPISVGLKRRLSSTAYSRPDGARMRGFGTDLIEKIVAHELGNPVDLRFEGHGVECTLTVPVREPSEFSLRARRPLEQ